jgi:hypothetical protein
VQWRDRSCYIAEKLIGRNSSLDNRHIQSDTHKTSVLPHTTIKRTYTDVIIAFAAHLLLCCSIDLFVPHVFLYCCYC